MDVLLVVFAATLSLGWVDRVNKGVMPYVDRRLSDLGVGGVGLKVRDHGEGKGRRAPNISFTHFKCFQDGI